MDKNSSMKIDDLLEMDPGFGFRPTDDELITHYLLKKVLDSSFSPTAIGEVDMNKVEPWEMPSRAKLGDIEWHFFCVRQKKALSGRRKNMSTAEGHWKAIGKDKKILCGKDLVGTKRMLVFYKGRRPYGEQTNWFSYEYRLDGIYSSENLPEEAKRDWVINKVYRKTCDGKKVQISSKNFSRNDELEIRSLLPMMGDDPSPSHMHGFSNIVNAYAPQEEGWMMTNFVQNPMLPSSSSNPLEPIQTAYAVSGVHHHAIQPETESQFSGSVPLQDPSIPGIPFSSYGQNQSVNDGEERKMVYEH